MVYEFKSRATGSVVMTQSVAERLLSIVGKSPGATGIITVAQMPAAVEALKAAIASERPPAAAEAKPGADDKETSAEPAVGLSARAFPLIEMMERAAKAGKDITWGI